MGFDLLDFPEDFDPENYTTQCVRLEIPSGIEFQMAIRALLNKTMFWDNWKRDNAKRGTKIAGIFRKQILNTLVFEDCSSMTFDCGDVEDCFESSEAIQNSIDTKIKNYGNSNNPNQPSVGGNGKGSTENLVGSNSQGCNEDEIWGNCVALVEQLHNNTVDFFEQIEALTNSQEIAAKIVGAIPLLETLPLDEVIEIGDNFRQLIVDMYNAVYTDDLANEFTADLFCKAVENCELTVKDAFDILKPKVEAAYPQIGDLWDNLHAISEMLRSFVELTGGGVAVYAFWAAQLGLANSLNNAFGFTISELIMYTKLGIPDNDWSIWAEDCAYTYLLYDFTLAQQGFSVFGTRGSYVPPFNSTRFQEGSSYYIAVHIKRQIGAAAGIRRIEIDLEMTAGTQQTTPYSRFQIIGSNGSTVKQNITIQSGQLAEGNHTITYEPVSPITILASEYIRFDRWLYDNANGVTSGYATAKIKKIRLYFTDDAPTDWGGEVV